MRKFLLCLVCLAWSMGGCAVMNKVKELVGRIEICVKGVCIRLDKNGDGELESHLTFDKKEDPHAAEDDSNR